jgi:hypothetical protein
MADDGHTPSPFPRMTSLSSANESSRFSKAWKKLFGLFQALEAFTLTFSNAWKKRQNFFQSLENGACSGDLWSPTIRHQPSTINHLFRPCLP